MQCICTGYRGLMETRSTSGCCAWSVLEQNEIHMKANVLYWTWYLHPWTGELLLCFTFALPRRGMKEFKNHWAWASHLSLRGDFQIAVKDLVSVFQTCIYSGSIGQMDDVSAFHSWAPHTFPDPKPFLFHEGWCRERKKWTSTDLYRCLESVSKYVTVIQRNVMKSCVLS